MMDANTVVQATIGIIDAVMKALTPAALGAYKVAVVGAQMQALNNLTTHDLSTVLWLLIGCIGFPLLIWGTVITIKLITAIGEEYALLVVPLTVGWLIEITIFAANVGSLGNIIFDYQMYQHPDAYLSYQIMNKITEQ